LLAGSVWLSIDVLGSSQFTPGSRLVDLWWGCSEQEGLPTKRGTKIQKK
jgi:hypothetical protein